MGVSSQNLGRANRTALFFAEGVFGSPDALGEIPIRPKLEPDG
jgi:hypothetical protein